VPTELALTVHDKADVQQVTDDREKQAMAPIGQDRHGRARGDCHHQHLWHAGIDEDGRKTGEQNHRGTSRAKDDAGRPGKLSHQTIEALPGTQMKDLDTFPTPTRLFLTTG
jgi:hypothetical protein